MITVNRFFRVPFLKKLEGEAWHRYDPENNVAMIIDRTVMGRHIGWGSYTWLLNGKWKICIDSPQEFTPGTSSALRWSDIIVPGECQMQGYPIKHENPFIYELTFMVPPDFKNKDILLCFDGVYSFARQPD